MKTSAAYNELLVRHHAGNAVGRGGEQATRRAQRRNGREKQEVIAPENFGVFATIPVLRRGSTPQLGTRNGVILATTVADTAGYV